uniref:Venom peptide 6 n=1 Tax=Eumenes pomiformis TaxID=693051 RepID=PROT6_EUMPO|nr:RecName: Full=Venom peptide 6; Short=EpVP6; Short=VP6; AltName: Full=Protonectin VP6; Flags: Precursor [Eumenes pomiformis]ACZ37399.1 VP6 protein precursor [Eumenes pomiformis]
MKSTSVFILFAGIAIMACLQMTGTEAAPSASPNPTPVARADPDPEAFGPVIGLLSGILKSLL